MMQEIKNILKKTGVHKLKKAAVEKITAARFKGKKPQQIFTDIYKNNSWNGKESISGAGSDLSETEELLRQLPLLLKKYDIKRIIDLPCGDFNWMRHLEYDFDHYTGIDIVPEIIEINNQNFRKENRIFKVKNCLEDTIEEADLLFSRDLLIHFSQQDVLRFFKKICQSNITYLLTTHFIDEQNKDIVTGQWCPINLQAPPYEFEKPLDIIIEKTKMFNGRFSKNKTMALWHLGDIRQFLEN